MCCQTFIDLRIFDRLRVSDSKLNRNEFHSACVDLQLVRRSDTNEIKINKILQQYLNLL